MTLDTSRIRQTVVELCVRLSQRGHFSGTGGNIALRIDAAHMAVTPSATDYLRMGAADVCVLRLADLQQVQGALAPSVESGLHARVLKARPDVGASIHTHQPVASACALLGQPLAVPAGALQASLGPRVPMVGYAPSGSAWLSAKLGRALRPHTQAYLMRNHGALCCGGTAEQALQAVEDLEALCLTLLRERMVQRSAHTPALQALLPRVLDALAG